LIHEIREVDKIFNLHHLTADIRHCFKNDQIMSTDKLNIAVIYGSVRTERQGIRAARYVVSQLNKRGHVVTLVDPLAVGLPLIDKRYSDYAAGKAPPELSKLADLYHNTDGYLIVSAEYNHNPPPALTNLLDYFFVEYFYRPSAILTYSTGSFGGVRASQHLRALLAQLGMSSIPTMLPIPFISKTFDESGNLLDSSYKQRFQSFFAEFEWYTRALKTARAAGLPGK
jgi:NAD(P)H-dependent FMN reductase